MADWQAFTVTVPGKDLLEPIREVLETLLVFLEVLKAILETIKAFLIDFGNPIRALVESLIKLIEELFLALKATGFFAYFDVPDPMTDPNFQQVVGGFPAFTTRFKQSLFDTQDFNRPQPRSGSTKSGFVLLCVDASDPIQLIRRIRQLLQFFGKDLTTPRYAPPVNLTVGPLGASGDPILDVASVFQEQPIRSIGLTWTMPSTVETPDPGFQDAVSKVGAEFQLPSFVIEKSVVNPVAQKITLQDLTDPDAAGMVEFDRETNVDVTVGSRFAKPSGTVVLRRETLRDELGEPFVKFQKYIPVPAGTLALGQLGTYRYVDDDVVAGETYYYRVRAYSGTLNVSGERLQNLPTGTAELDSGMGSNTKIPLFKWPSTDATDPAVMGVPTQIVQIRVPEFVDFDVVENLFNTFLSAFTLDFHQTLPADSEFDPNGVNIPPTPVHYIGRGLLAQSAGFLAGFSGDNILGTLAEFETVALKTDFANLTSLLPWQNFAVRRHARRLAVTMASLLLEANNALAYRDLMRGTLPRGPVSDVVGLDGLASMEEIVAKFVEVVSPSNSSTDIQTDAQASSVQVDVAGLNRFVSGYDSESLRLNLAVVVGFLRAFSLGGQPPNWIAVVPLRDIIPWAGQFLYDILDKIDALLAAFAGFLEEIKRFIDLLIRKIEALERFLQLIIDILNFVESLSISAYVLSVPEVSGDATAWISEIDNAGGDIPPSGPGGYSGGVGLAYVAPDISAFKAAFSIIFGS